MNDAYKDALRSYIAANGKPAMVDRDAECVEDEVSEYGWVAYDPLVHTSDPAKVYKGEGCRWLLPEGTVVTERTYDLFENTGHAHKREVGFNAYPAHCACGKYANVTLRVTTSLGEALAGILAADGTVTL